MHFVKEATYQKNYSLLLKFEDWKSKLFDMSPFIENTSLLFRPLKQKEIFKMFSIKNNTVTWITWADVSPDFLYENSIEENDCVNFGEKWVDISEVVSCLK